MLHLIILQILQIKKTYYKVHYIHFKNRLLH